MPTNIPISEHISPRSLEECESERRREEVYRPCIVCEPSRMARDNGYTWDEIADRWVPPAAPALAFSMPIDLSNYTVPLFSWTRSNTSGEINMPELPSYVYCYDCDARHLESSSTQCSTCDAIVCPACIANHEHTGEFCVDCDYNALASDTVRWCDSHSAYYCSTHAWTHSRCRNEAYEIDDPGRYNGRPPVSGYGREATLDLMDRPFTPSPLAQGTRAAAVELECEYDDSIARSGVLTLPDTVGIGDDGSLSNGLEVTTPPTRGAALQRVLTDTCTALREGGYVVRESCGMHTHIDLRDKKNDKKFLAHLFNAFFAIEDILYAMQSSYRHASSYSVPLRRMYKFFDMYGKKTGDFDYTFYKQPKTVDGKYYVDREKERKYASVRYAAFNFHSVYYRGSLECRLHEGCLDEVDALRWIDLLQTIIARVERGHSYMSMVKFTNMTVTTEKVNAFARYFGLTTEQKEFVIRRINTGQGFGFDLGHVQWGEPVRGRPTKEPVANQMAYVGQRVRCQNCSYEWVLRARDYACPRCLRYLFTPQGTRNYVRVPGAPRRRSRRSTAPVYETAYNNMLDFG